MPSTAALLRVQIERSLERRFPSALTPAPRCIREVMPVGIESVDALLEGGLPVGAISELTGPECSGRTSLALAFLAQHLASEHVCAWVDIADSLDPESAAASGIDLRRLLWVRCSNTLRDQSVKPLARLDQALRATDLLLQVGGFGAIVLDLGGMSPEHGMRIPLTTWFRWRQAADRTRCCLLVLGKAAYAQSSAAAVIECSPLRSCSAGETVLEKFEFTVTRRRERFAPWAIDMCKPPASTWTAPVPWDVEKCG
jgi:recombination protein RecA